MKILLVDPSSHGGIAIYTGLIAQALAAAGAEPTVLGSRSLAGGERPYPVLRRLPSLRWGRPAGAALRFYFARASGWTAAALAIHSTARRRRPDVIHFQAPVNRRFDAALVRTLRRVAPVVWTAHDVLPFEGTERDEGRFAAIYRAADLVLVHGQHAADQVRGLADVEPVVVEHVVAEPLVRTSRAEARNLLDLPVEGRILAALGFVRPYKGYRLLADVWEALGEAAPLLLVMGEVLDDGERAVLDRLERTGRVVLRLGYARDDDLQGAIAAADAVLLPYEMSSESGLLHQARAFGVPVLASDVPQLAAAVEATSAGRVLPREVDAWREAVTGPLPDAPPVPASLQEVAEAHLRAYEEARRRADPR